MNELMEFDELSFLHKSMEFKVIMVDFDFRFVYMDAQKYNASV